MEKFTINIPFSYYKHTEFEPYAFEVDNIQISEHCENSKYSLIFQRDAEKGKGTAFEEDVSRLIKEIKTIWVLKFDDWPFERMDITKLYEGRQSNVEEIEAKLSGISTLERSVESITIIAKDIAKEIKTSPLKDIEPILKLMKKDGLVEYVLIYYYSTHLYNIPDQQCVYHKPYHNKSIIIVELYKASEIIGKYLSLNKNKIDWESVCKQLGINYKAAKRACDIANEYGFRHSLSKSSNREPTEKETKDTIDFYKDAAKKFINNRLIEEKLITP